MHIIIVGAGNIGTPLTRIATRSGHDVVLIEQDREKADEASAQFDCLVLNADATVRDTLEEAGIDRADAVISTTDKDATNVMVCLLAEEFGIPRIVSVVHNPAHMPVFEKVGVHTMENPQRLIAEYLFRGATRPNVHNFMQVGEGGEVVELEVGAGAPVVGRSLADLRENGVFTDQDLVVAIQRDHDLLVPSGNTELRAGDIATIFAGTGLTPELAGTFASPSNGSSPSATG